MKIKKSFQIITLVTILVFLIAGLAFLSLYRDIEKNQEEMILALVEVERNTKSVTE